jgi:hypothetical protein
MAATPSVKIVRVGSYRAGSKQWSNRFHFAGGTPADLTHWTTLVNNIVAAEKPCLSPDAGYVEAVCYAAGSDLPLHTISLSGSGSMSGSGANAVPLETCALLRWTTDQRTSKNHPIYLFSYMHDVFVANTGSHEAVLAAERTLLSAYAASWTSGFSDGTNTYPRAGPNGAVAQSGTCEQYFSHRDFPT